MCIDGVKVVLWPYKNNFHFNPSRINMLFFLYKRPKYWYPEPKNKIVIFLSQTQYVMDIELQRRLNMLDHNTGLYFGLHKR